MTRGSRRPQRYRLPVSEAYTTRGCGRVEGHLVIVWSRDGPRHEAGAGRVTRNCEHATSQTVTSQVQERDYEWWMLRTRRHVLHAGPAALLGRRLAILLVL